MSLTETYKRSSVFIKTLQKWCTFCTFHACISNVIRYECRTAENFWKNL